MAEKSGSYVPSTTWAPHYGADPLREYRDCDRCGFTVPRSELVQEGNLLVCRERCLFEPHPGGRAQR